MSKTVTPRLTMARHRQPFKRNNMEISAQDVKNLRVQTGAGLMDCKKALVETKGDFAAAVDHLKKQGLAKAALKGERVAAEGLIFAKVEDNTAALVELNCETDFVAKNEGFQKLGHGIVAVVFAQRPSTLEQLRGLKLGAETVTGAVSAHSAHVGEKIDLRRFFLFDAKKGGRVVLYNHSGGKIAVLIEVCGPKVTLECCRDIAMQVGSGSQFESVRATMGILSFAASRTAMCS